MYVCNCGEEFHAHEDRTIHSASCPIFGQARKAQRAAMTTEQRAQDLVNGFFIGGPGDTLEGILTKADLVSAMDWKATRELVPRSEAQELNTAVEVRLPHVFDIVAEQMKNTRHRGEEIGI